MPRTGACPGPTPRGEEGTNGWCLIFADFVSLQGNVDKRTHKGLLHLACMLGVCCILGQRRPSSLELTFRCKCASSLRLLSWSSCCVWRHSSWLPLRVLRQRQWLNGCQRPGWGKSPVSNIAGLKSGTACVINRTITRSLELFLTHDKKQRNPGVQLADCSQGCSASALLSIPSSVI